MPADLRERLIALETSLRPADLEQRVRSVVFSTHGGAEFEDYDEDGVADIHERTARAEAIAQELGKAIATEEPLLTRLLPEIVSGDGRLCFFGMGLMEGATDARLMWQRLTDAMTALEERSRRPLVLGGFLRALQGKDPALAAQLLDEAVEDETHSPYYPYLQVAIPIGEQDVARLKRSLALGRTPARAYVSLAYGRATVRIHPADLRALVLALAALPDGYDVALKVLHMRLHADSQQELDPALIVTGQELLRGCSFEEKNDGKDYCVGQIARACLCGEPGSIVAQELCAKLKDAVATHVTHPIYHSHILLGLFIAQPFASLNALCAGNENDLTRGIRILQDVRSRKDLISVIPEEELLRWCDEEPNTHYPAIAAVLPITHRTEDTDPLRWTTLALRFLEKAPDPATVLREYVNQFTPHRWGSLAATLEANATLLDELDGSARLATAVALEKERMREAIEWQRRFELAHDRERDERFE